MFAVSQGHNYGLQLADLVTTVIGLRFQGERRISPLFKLVQDMLYVQKVGAQNQSSLKVMRAIPTEIEISTEPPAAPAAKISRDSAALRPMTG